MVLAELELAVVYGTVELAELELAEFELAEPELADTVVPASCVSLLDRCI